MSDKAKMNLLYVEDNKEQREFNVRMLRDKFGDVFNITEIGTVDELHELLKELAHDKQEFDISLLDNEIKQKGRTKLDFHEEIFGMSVETRMRLGYLINVSATEKYWEDLIDVIGEEYTGKAIKGGDQIEELQKEVENGMNIQHPLNRFKSTPEQDKLSQLFFDELDEWNKILENNHSSEANRLKKAIAEFNVALLIGIDRKSYYTTVRLGERMEAVRKHELLKDKISNSDLINTNEFIKSTKKALNDIVKIAEKAIEEQDIDKLCSIYEEAQEVRGLIYLFGEGRINDPVLYSQLTRYISVIFDSIHPPFFAKMDLEKKKIKSVNWDKMKEANNTFSERIAETENSAEEMIELEQMSLDDFHSKILKLYNTGPDIKILSQKGLGKTGKQIRFSERMYYFIKSEFAYNHGHVWDGSTRTEVSPEVSFEFSANGWTLKSEFEIIAGEPKVEEEARNKIQFVVEKHLGGRVDHFDKIEDGKVQFSATFPYVEKGK